MFKNSILRYLNSAAVYSPDDPAAIAAAQRAAISNTVTVSARSDNEPPQNNNEAGNDEDAGNNDEDNGEDEDGEDDSNKDEDDEDNGKSGSENETDEQKQQRLAAEAEAAKDQRKKDRIQKRIDRLVAEGKNKDAELEKLRAQLAEKPNEGLSEEEVERRAEAKAKRLAEQQAAEFNQRQFQKDCDAVQAAALKTDPEFNKKIHEVVAETEKPIPGEMIAMLTELDNENGGDVLAFLASDVDLYDEVTGMTLGKMQQKLIRISDKLKNDKKPKPKQQSKVPPPITPVNTGRNKGSNDQIPTKPTENMEDFIRVRNQQAAEYRKRRGGF